MGKKTQLKVAHAHYEKGLIHNEQGNWGLADEEFHRALFIFRSLTVWEQVLNCHKSIGNVCFNKKLFSDTLKNWEAAASIAEHELHSRVEAGALLLDIGDLHYEMANLFAAGHAYEKAHSFFAENPTANELRLGGTEHKLGNVAFRMDRFDKAEQHFLTALRVFESHGKEKKVGAVLKALGRIELVRKELQPAKRYLMRSFEIYSRLGRDDVKNELSMLLQDIENREQKRELQRRLQQLQAGSSSSTDDDADDTSPVAGRHSAGDSPYPMYAGSSPSRATAAAYQPVVSAPRRKLEEANTRLIYQQATEDKVKARLSPDVLLSRSVADKKENISRKW
eukprot:TRINITY_DN18355_c0_g1_i1.p1 TRINITY_DN18355_c0_g1~~TRINITY_DN18355_c0_g1_i1.p1  ORF type:complete len:337 (+),score=128.18 TRINITY_DN18355_c0_g1_i1:148-1158(+)